MSKNDKITWLSAVKGGPLRDQAKEKGLELPRDGETLSELRERGYEIDRLIPKNRVIRSHPDSPTGYMWTVTKDCVLNAYYEDVARAALFGITFYPTAEWCRFRNLGIVDQTIPNYYFVDRFNFEGEYLMGTDFIFASLPSFHLVRTENERRERLGIPPLAEAKEWGGENE